MKQIATNIVRWVDDHDLVKFMAQLVMWSAAWYFAWPYLLSLTLTALCIIGLLTFF